MRLIAALLVAAGVGMLPIAANATETVLFDGAWWQSLTRNEQVLVVEGILVGRGAGWNSGVSASAQKIMKMPPRRDLPPAESNTLLDSVLKLFSAPGGARSPYTFGTIADRISAVYRDHPRLIDLKVDVLVDCAAYKTNGCEQNARQTEKARGLPPSP